MKTAIRTLTLVIMTLLAGSCTRNNGDIGPWFGFWQLTSIEIDGRPSETYKGNIVWSFQNDIINILTYGDRHDYVETWGTWSVNDEETAMTVIFSHTDDTDNKGQYIAPEELGFSQTAPNVFEIERLSTREATLRGVSTRNGRTYVYRLKKSY